ncbi:coiled-coil domain-containing protein 159-like [Acipenser ruthenus]|uniref:coiled-coil domain-containing protein 159-like n=1 Tax=Acipenser ruthenus TaxID=7906 RepID=UPI002740CB32|nr:coiled-coil domain-containing protein 159-like [Acipenser ruthenus]
MNTERLRAYSQLSADENGDTRPSPSPGINETQLFEAQKMLKDDLEAVKRHLFAQAKSVEAFNRTITLLERERSQQFNKIRAFQEELRRLGQVVDRQNQDSQLEKRFQALSQELSGKLLFLRGLIEQGTTQHLQTPLPGCSPGLPLCDSQRQEALNDITQEISESKKFLWEEMEAIRAEIDDIKQKLSKYSFISMATESINPLLSWIYQCSYRSSRLMKQFHNSYHSLPPSKSIYPLVYKYLLEVIHFVKLGETT